MATTPQDFTQRLTMLAGQIAEQGRRVQALIETAFDSAFARDVSAGDRVMALDNEIDRVDVEIERACVQVLTDATAAGAALMPAQLRAVLTIVKVNNELERIADLGVRIATHISELPADARTIPETFRVLANSVVGILRDTNTSLERGDAALARVVLASEDAVEAFKRAVVRDVQQRVASGRMAVETASTLYDLASVCESMADHCTNMAEQVIYVATGTIVRHTEGRWEEIPIAPQGRS